MLPVLCQVVCNTDIMNRTSMCRKSMKYVVSQPFSALHLLKRERPRLRHEELKFRKPAKYFFYMNIFGTNKIKVKKVINTPYRDLYVHTLSSEFGLLLPPPCLGDPKKEQKLLMKFVQGCWSGEKERGMNMEDIFELYLNFLRSADCPSTATFRWRTNFKICWETWRTKFARLGHRGHPERSWSSCHNLARDTPLQVSWLQVFVLSHLSCVFLFWGKLDI